MMTIEQMIDDLIKNREGGFVNDPDDKGGATKYGITQQTLSDYLGRPASIHEVENLDRATADAIYRANYYIASHVDRMPDVIQPQLFDMCVNHGNHKAIVILQRALNKGGATPPLSEDGVYGSNTIGAAEKAAKCFGQKLNNIIATERVLFYANILANNPSQGRFYEGWIHRAESFRC